MESIFVKSYSFRWGTAVF